VRRLAFALVVLTLAGCAGHAPQSQGTDVASPSAVASPTATQPAETGTEPPRQVFGGDCASLFTTSEVTHWLGRGATLQPQEDVPGTVEQAGGIRCSWVKWSDDGEADSDEAGSSADGLYLSVLPVALGRATANADACEAELEEVYLCPVVAEANGYRLTGTLSATSPKAASTAAEIEDLFVQRTSLREPGAMPDAVVGAWANPVDLDVLGAVDVAAITGRSDIVEDGANCGCDFVEDGRKYWGDGADTGDYDDDLSVDAIGGGAWVADQVADLEGAKSIEIDGVDRAILIVVENYTTVLEVFDGPNRLSIWANGPDIAWTYPVAAAFVAELNEQR